MKAPFTITYLSPFYLYYARRDVRTIRFVKPVRADKRMEEYLYSLASDYRNLQLCVLMVVLGLWMYQYNELIVLGVGLDDRRLKSCFLKLRHKRR